VKVIQGEDAGAERLQCRRCAQVIDVPRAGNQMGRVRPLRLRQHAAAEPINNPPHVFVGRTRHRTNDTLPLAGVVLRTLHL
jgi:hypothetical protein